MGILVGWLGGVIWHVGRKGDRAPCLGEVSVGWCGEAGEREGRRGIILVGWKGKYRVMTKKLEPMAVFLR